MSRGERQAEQAADARHERRVLWLGVVALLVVVGLVLVRHAWWVYG